MQEKKDYGVESRRMDGREQECSQEGASPVVQQLGSISDFNITSPAAALRAAWRRARGEAKRPVQGFLAIQDGEDGDLDEDRNRGNGENLSDSEDTLNVVSTGFAEE